MIDMFRPFMSPNVLDALKPILSYDKNNRMYIGEGDTVKQFETAFKEYCWLDNDVLALNSGTSALELAGQLIGLDSDSEVITTPQTCTATQVPMTLFKSKIVWADINPITGLIDVKDVERKITRKTKAIFAVNWGGRMADYKSLKQFGIPVVEDAAHGTYATGLERGDYIIWSTQAIKMLTTVDGGILYTPKEDYDNGRLLRWYGLDRLSSNDFRCAQDITLPGRKLHMNNVNAAIGLENLKYLPFVEKCHKTIAAKYSLGINNPLIKVPAYDPNSSYWLFTILCETRDHLKDYLKARGIDSSQVHARNDKHTLFKNSKVPLPHTDYFDARQLNIPVGWHLEIYDVDNIINALNAYEV